MKKRRSLFLLPGVLFAAVLFAILTSGAQGIKESPTDSSETRADIITIDTLKSFGELEQPPVTFLHDKHTDALEKKNKDCAACHMVENDRQSPKFKRLKDVSRLEVMDIYHAECMQCHRNMAKAEVKSGPIEKCGGCHQPSPRVISDRQLIGFDKSLHYRHVMAAQDKCERCHHQYDEVAKKLVYEKGTEGTCRYCHKQKTEENRISLKQASHLQCVDCHRKTIAEARAKKLTGDKIAGPFKCSGCHDEQMQVAIKSLKDVPRMKRNQPDVVLIQPVKKDVDNPQMAAAVLMNPVPFDHKAHEQYNDSCRACHHADLQKCGTCHTVRGTKEGDYVRSERAMHQFDSDRSCLGCHTSRQIKPSCAGCHTSIPIKSKQQTSYCVQCHMKPPQLEAGVKLKPEAMAGMLLQSRTAVTDTYGDEDIPEMVTIKELSNEYEAVQFPHRRIVRRLVADIQKDTLANYFHSQKGTICLACHHNSPSAKKPPRCFSCHGKPFDETQPLRPGMKGAYHLQCMGCHQELGLTKPDSLNCVECHKKKNS